MPELPEVETTGRGIRPYVENNEISHAIIRNYSLRLPVNKDLTTILSGKMIATVKRRGKYLLFNCNDGTLIIHLGMSGRLQIIAKAKTQDIGKHDHVDIVLKSGDTLRYTDPRRFGIVLWAQNPWQAHRLLAHLGPEPLTNKFNADYLLQHSKKRKRSIKTLIMDSKIVVGIGNIYANEALFLAGIHPKKAANTLSAKNCISLVAAIKTILDKAIKAGGTSLKDFRKSNGKLGWFTRQLNVYGRKDKDCLYCKKAKIQHCKEGQRATFYCPVCQK